MGTSNFYNRNASKIFAISGTFENEEGETEIDEFIYDDTKGNIQSELKDFTSCDKWESNGLRSYDGTIFAEKTEWKTFAGAEFGVKIQCIARSGYYDGANFDWEVTFEDAGGNDFDEVDESDIKDILEYYADSPKVKGIVAPHVAKWLEKTKTELVEKVEKVYEMYTDKLVVTARFSNGETMYAKV